MRGDNLEREHGINGNKFRRRTQLLEGERSWNLQASENSSARKYLYTTLTRVLQKGSPRVLCNSIWHWVGFGLSAVLADMQETGISHERAL